MTNLFSPLKIRGIELKNRIVMSPMCQYSGKDGFATDWHLIHYGSRAIGGTALIIQEATAVSPEGRISPSDLGLWKDEHIEHLQKITQFIHQQGSHTGIQLAHAGRKANMSEPWNGDKLIPLSDGGWKAVAPSAIQFSEVYDVPLALTEQGINKLVNEFQSAAVRAIKAGFDVIEIHAAHGYLINEFLSPFSNKRSDKYGGSFENRIRFLIEVIQAIRKTIPEQNPVFVRLSTTEWAEGGWTLDDSIALSKILKQNGVDLIDCSSGGNILGVKIKITPGYQVPLATTIKQQVDILTGAVGLILDPKQADEIISNEQSDLVFLGRELLRNPYFPLSASKELGYETPCPKQYLRAKK